MNKKYYFHEGTCRDCPHLNMVGSELFPTKYCGGFQRKKPKRFKSSDPQYKAPKWCPRRLPVPVCRIYGFIDEMNRAMDRLNREEFERQKWDHIIPLPHRYKLRAEFSFGMTAAAFFKAAQKQPLEDVLPDADLDYGEVIELDDGLKPYYFYCLNYSTIVPVLLFTPPKDAEQ